MNQSSPGDADMQPDLHAVSDVKCINSQPSTHSLHFMLASIASSVIAASLSMTDTTLFFSPDWNCPAAAVFRAQLLVFYRARCFVRWLYVVYQLKLTFCVLSFVLCQLLSMWCLQGGTKQVSKQASKPSFSLPSLGGKAQQVGKTAKVKAGSASQKASFSLPSLGGKAKQVGKTAKVKAGSAPQKIGFSLPSLGGKAKQVGKTAQVKAGTASTKAKQATPKGIFGTSSTRGKSSSPAKGGGPLGTRSTRPASGV